MKEVLSLFTLIIGASCFVVFLTVFKPDAIGTVPGRSKPGLRVSQQSHQNLAMITAFIPYPLIRNSRISLLRALCRRAPCGHSGGGI
jgi:hypothetical protein